jgi:hypothetical protein
VSLTAIRQVLAVTEDLCSGNAVLVLPQRCVLLSFMKDACRQL